jgi:hypothetical protein
MTKDSLQYLIRCKSAGIPNDQIAGRLGISIEEVEKQWKQAVQTSLRSSNGFQDFVNQFTTLAHQYQLVGESLKVFANCLSNTPSIEEIRNVLTDDKEESALAILSSFLVFRAFQYQDVEELIKKTLKDN